METLEQQKARYEFYKSILNNGDALVLIFLSLAMVLGFVLILVAIVFAASGAFATSA